MLGYFKLLALIMFLMLFTSGIADARFPRTVEIVSQEALEAELEALPSLKEVYENEATVDFLNEELRECLPSKHVCAISGPPKQCCSGACVPHPLKRVFVCM